MASLRQIRRRIKSVQNTKKITRAMEMVAAAKLRRFEQLVEQVRHSRDFLTQMVQNLCAAAAGYEHPYFMKREAPKKIAAVVVTSDTGLCGTYNSLMLAEINRFLKEHADQEVELISVGKTSTNHYKQHGHAVERAYLELRFANYEQYSLEIKNYVSEAYLAGELDEVYLIYTQFQTKSNYAPTTRKLLSFEPPEEQSDEDTGYIFEPSVEVIFDQLLPQVLLSQVRGALLEGSLSEQLSRMMAMRQATDNATEMIDDLTLLRNKMRQATITQELMEIVSGAKSLEH